MVAGMIILWAGAIVDIPTGFVLCNGSNGSPDLRNRFIPGAGDTYAVSATGGSDTQTHTFTSNTHDHQIGAGSNIAAGTDYNAWTQPAQTTGTTDSSDNRPQYYALAYIMKT